MSISIGFFRVTNQSSDKIHCSVVYKLKDGSIHTARLQPRPKVGAGKTKKFDLRFVPELTNGIQAWLEAKIAGGGNPTTQGGEDAKLALEMGHKATAEFEVDAGFPAPGVTYLGLGT